MDPEALNHTDWRNTSILLRYLWFIVIFAFGFSTHMVLAHAIIPSLVNSGHLPPTIENKLKKIRTPFYLLSLIVILGFICFWFAKATEIGYRFQDFYPRGWI